MIDPSDPQAASDPLACLNVELVRDGELDFSLQLGRCLRLTSFGWFVGLATADRSIRYAGAYPQMIERIKKGQYPLFRAIFMFKADRCEPPASEGAKRDRYGIFE